MINRFKGLITRKAAAAALAAALAWQGSAMQSAADPINIDIGPGFKWRASDVNRLADSAARLFAERCRNGCTVQLRIQFEGGSPSGMTKRIDWLKRSIVDRLEGGSGGQVTVVDVVQFS